MSTHAENVYLMNENSDLRKQVRELAAALREIASNDPYKVSSAGIIARAALAKLDGKP